MLKLLIFRCTRCSETGAHSDHFILHINSEEGMRVSHETVYRALYAQGRGSLREELEVELVLRSGRRSRRRRSLPPDPRGRRTWAEGAEIALRPPEADSRAVPGHWEGDLVVGSDGASCV